MPRKWSPQAVLAGVPAGTMIHSTHPTHKAKRSTRAQRVYALIERYGGDGSQDRATWPGTGGYWRWCNPDAVTVIEEERAAA